MSDLDTKIRLARQVLTDAVAEHQPREIFALFSGGYDSLVVAHLVSRFSINAGVAHLNTGIGIEETRVYVRETCASRLWPLAEYHTPESYEQLVIERGFPGPAHHWKMYCRLKDRSVEALVRDNKRQRYDRIMLVTGIRQQESKKRAKYKNAIQRRGAQVWVNPILGWSKIDVHAYKARYDLPDNEVVQLLHMSGECLCGAYARKPTQTDKGELAEIRLWYPKFASYIDDLTVKVKAAGHDWKWDECPPPKQFDTGQQSLFMPLCQSCELTNAGVNRVEQ